MSVKQLIRDFSARTSVPVEIDDVIAAIRAKGVIDEIYPFWDVNLDPRILKGYIKHDELIVDETGKTKRVAEITYAKMGHETERLVCCKEILHIIDPDAYRVSSPSQIEELVERIVLPPDLVDESEDGLPVLSDRLALWEATAVLFPLATRNLVLPAFTNGRMSLAEIADLVEIPVRYAAMVMSGVWEQIHTLLITENNA